MQLPRPAQLSSVPAINASAMQWANLMETQLEQLLNTFTTYVPVWSSTGTAPVIGNGVLDGRYCQHGKLIVLGISLQLGSTSTVGTGSYSLGLPVAAAVTGRYFGSGVFYDSSAAATYGVIGIVRFTTVDAVDTAKPAGAVSATSPVVPATGDIWAMTLSYETA